MNVVGTVAAGQTEKHLVAGVVEWHAAHAIGHRQIFLRRERLRIVPLDDQTAARQPDVFVQQFIHPVGVGRVEWTELLHLLRLEDPQQDRFLYIRQDLLGPWRQGEHPVLGQVDPRIREHRVRQDIERHEEDHRANDDADGEEATVGGLRSAGHVRHPPFFSSISAVLTNRLTTISETK